MDFCQVVVATKGLDVNHRYISIFHQMFTDDFPWN